MTSPATNPFASYSAEDQAAIRKQLVDLSSSGQLNPAQQKSVALALTQMGEASGFPSNSSSTPVQESGILDKASQGLVSPDLILKLGQLPTSPAQIVPWLVNPPVTISDLESKSHGDPAKSPLRNAFQAGTAGAVADTAKTVSGFTSPISIATLALSPLAKGTGMLSTAAKAALTAAGLTFGAQGVGNVAEGVGKGVTTPEGAQEILGGLSQIAGAAPAVASLATAVRGAAAHAVPQAFAEGENAFVKVLNPDRKVVPKIRDAYQTVAPELAKTQIKDLPDLESVAEVRRNQVANQLKAELAKVNPHATQIDPMAVYRAIRSQVNDAMRLGSPAEAKAIAEYAYRVRQDLTVNPKDISQAEDLVQQINRRTTQFQRMSPDAKYTAAANGSPNAAEVAFKDALQEQIEAKLSGYKDLKRQYGAWKEIQNQTNARMDVLAKEQPNSKFWQKRGIESLFAGAGLFLGGHGGSPYEGGITGYLMGRVAAEAYLNKLANPDRMLQRAIHPSSVRPNPFAGQAVQPAVQQLLTGGGSAF